MSKFLFGKTCLATCYAVCLLIKSCDLWLYESQISCYFHNAAPDTIYVYSEFRNDIPFKPSVAHIRGYEVFELSPDSLFETHLRESVIKPEKTVFSFVVFSKETYGKYTIDEIRENGIMDWGRAYRYEELKKMNMTISYKGK